MKRLALVLLALAALAASAGALAAHTAGSAGRCLAPTTRGSDGDFEVVIGASGSRTTAVALVRHGQRLGFKNLAMAQRGSRYEVSLVGMKTAVELVEEKQQVRKAGLRVVRVDSVARPCV